MLQKRGYQTLLPLPLGCVCPDWYAAEHFEVLSMCDIEFLAIWFLFPERTQQYRVHACLSLSGTGHFAICSPFLVCNRALDLDQIGHWAYNVVD